MINENQLHILKAMEVDVWVRPHTQAPNYAYVVIANEDDWHNKDYQQMCQKLLAAIAWPMEACKVLHPSSQQYDTPQQKKGIIFGYDQATIMGTPTKDSPFVHDVGGVSFAVLPALDVLHQSRSEKQKSWQLLKKFKDA